MEIIYVGNQDGNLATQESEWKVSETLPKPGERKKETAGTIILFEFVWGFFCPLFILLFFLRE